MTSSVYIAKNVYGGDGLGRLGDGRIVFVPGAWAGEQVKAEIVEEKKHFVKARLVEVIEASPDRIDTPSESLASFAPSSVPGMVYAGLRYEAELRAKEQQLRDFFERARIDCGSTIQLNPREVARGTMEGNYRNKVVYHFAKQGGRFVIGYRKEPSHEIVDIENDPLARPEINAKLPEIRRAVLALLTTGPQAVRRSTEEKENLTIRWSRISGVKWWLGKAPEDVVIKEETCGNVFEVPAGGFYQVNPEVGDALVRRVVEEVGSKSEELRVAEILDLYCGVGVFGISIAKEFASSFDPSRVARDTMEGWKLTGIESGRQAIDFAKRNAANILGKVAAKVGSEYQTLSAKFYAEEVGRNKKRIRIGENTVVIVDPPRGGLEPGVPEWLAASKAPRIVYVSCDPATLMRDLKVITRGYEVEKVEWFNMFPRTARFETMVVLKKK